MSEFITYMEKRMSETIREEKSLIASGRKDEANLQKIKNNVYGICKTVYEVADKKEGEEAAAFFVKKLEGLEAAWRESYEKAKEFSDAEKILVEETKLAALSEAREQFASEM